VYETIEELSKWPVLIRAAYTSGYVRAPLLIQPGCSWRAYSRFRFLIFFVKSPLKDLSSFEAKYLLDCQRDDNFFRMVRTLETGTQCERELQHLILPNQCVTRPLVCGFVLHVLVATRVAFRERRVDRKHGACGHDRGPEGRRA